MATTESNSARQAIDALWGGFMEADIDENDDVDIKGFNVKIEYGYKFDSWTQVPRITESAFDPVACSVFSALPVDRSYYKNDKLVECRTVRAREKKVVDITRAIGGIVDRWTFSENRLNIVPLYNAIWLSDLMGLRCVGVPNSFFLGGDLVGYVGRSIPRKRFAAGQIYETQRSGTNGAYPHITFLSFQPSYGRNNSILYGELYLLICAMRNRANQRKVDNEDEQEALLDRQAAERTLAYTSEVEKYAFEFPDERRFPILMASFVGPHHGRLFYATMENGTLHIRQSDLYDFRNQSVAPLDFFASILLSRPSGVPAPIPTHTVVQNLD